tara:strand:+ start:457 stop:933 length:477 start_codon:yes stop_codon:yes gene_type:complete
MEIQALLLSHSLNNDCVMLIQNKLCKLKKQNEDLLQEIKLLKKYKEILNHYRISNKMYPNKYTFYISNEYYNPTFEEDTFQIPQVAASVLENDLIGALNDNVPLCYGICDSLKTEHPKIRAKDLLLFSMSPSTNCFRIWNLMTTTKKNRFYNTLLTIV